MTIAEDLALEAISCLDETFSLTLGTVPAPGRWAGAGRCRNVPPSVFFPERGDSTEEAKRICAGCAVKDLCLEYAVAAGPGLHGVWGGTSAEQRRRIRAERERQADEPVAELAPVAELDERRPKPVPAGTMFKLLEQLTGHPGAWARIARYESDHTASAVASMLRSGTRPSPPGRWEFEGRQVDGGSALYALYLGAGEEVAS